MAALSVFDQLATRINPRVAALSAQWRVLSPQLSVLLGQSEASTIETPVNDTVAKQEEDLETSPASKSNPFSLLKPSSAGSVMSDKMVSSSSASQSATDEAPWKVLGTAKNVPGLSLAETLELSAVAELMDELVSGSGRPKVVLDGPAERYENPIHNLYISSS